MANDNDEIKLEIGKHILRAMKEIDIATTEIAHNLSYDGYEREVDKLFEIKKDLKLILNKHFDECAIRNGNTIPE